MADVKVVAPMNMGERLDWDAQNKKYNVNVSDILQTLTAHGNRLNALEGKEDGSIGFNSSSDLNKAIPRYGFSIMHGFGYVRGVPCNIYSKVHRQSAALSLDEYSADKDGDFERGKGRNNQYQDWTGWQIANNSEVVQFIQEEANNIANVWCRINSDGLSLVNGVPTIRNADSWTDWIRVTNVA